MAEDFSRSVLRVAFAQICQSLGWNSVQSTPLEVMTDVLERYILELGKYTHRYCEQFGRTEPNLDDLGLAFQELGISVPELQDFLKHVDPLPFAFDVPKFPVPRENQLNFPKPGSRELAEREEHIDDHYPPMHPEWNDDVPSTPTVETPTTRITDPSGLTSPAISADKRTFLSPDSSLKKTKTLPDEAGHSKYEMRGVSMSDHGYLTPTKQGKLPEARTPPPPASISAAETPIPLPRPAPVVPKTVTTETIIVHSPENSDQEFDIIDMPPSPEVPIVTTKPKVRKSPKGKPRSKSPKFQIPKKTAKSPVTPTKKLPFKSKKDAKKKKSAAVVEEVEAERPVTPPPLSPGENAAGRLAEYDDCIDSVLEHSKELERQEEEERERERERKEQEEQRRKKEEKEREEKEREREKQRERERKEREQREKEKKEAERKEREMLEKEMETQRLIEEIEMKKRQREEERLRKEERQRKEERERLERERRDQGLYSDDDDDDVELVYEDPTLPLELRESPTVSPIPKERKKGEKKEKSSAKSLKIKIGGIQEGKDLKKIQSPEWPKVSLEKLTPEDIRHFEYPVSPKQLPSISEETDEQPAIKPIRIGLGGKDFKIKPPRAEDSSKDHKRKKKKKDKDKDRERRKDKKHKKDKKRDKKDKEKVKEETATTPSIPKLTFKFGGSKGSKVTISHTSSDNTPRNSPSKTEEMMSPPGRAAALSPVHLSSPIAEPSSPSSPERSPPHKLPFRALHTPSPLSSRSPSPKRGRTESSDSPEIDLEIRRKLSRSPVRKSLTPPPRLRSPVSSASPPVSPLSPEPPPLPTHLVTPTVAAKAGKGPPAKGVISETIGKIVDDKGQITWICPTCKKVDDGTPMIGCDKCDDWYHWVCVGITAEPSDDQWYCERCSLIASTSQRGRGRGRGRGGRGRGMVGRGKGTGNKRGRKKTLI